MTFYLTSLRGCGGVVVYTQEPATWTQGDHVQVEGTFEIEHRRESITFHNEVQATKNRYIAKHFPLNNFADTPQGMAA
jgi:hypothetical protein